MFLSCVSIADDGLVAAVAVRVTGAAATAEPGAVEAAAGHDLPGPAPTVPRPPVGGAALVRQLQVSPSEPDVRRGVTVTGELDLATAPLLAAETADAGNAWSTHTQAMTGGGEFDLDLAGLTFVDVSGLRALEQIQRQVQACDGALRVIAPAAPGPRKAL